MHGQSWEDSGYHPYFFNHSHPFLQILWDYEPGHGVDWPARNKFWSGRSIKSIPPGPPAPAETLNISELFNLKYATGWHHLRYYMLLPPHRRVHSAAGHPYSQ
jgi:hypothetical protein